MDLHICRWISEFLMRNTAQEQVIKKVLAVLPVTNADSRFRKTVLLRTIQAEIADALVSETMLERLELVEELDRSDGNEITELMKSAYLAVAVECTVKYLLGSPDKHGKYFEAVKKVWRGRIGNLEKLGKSEFLTAELKKWRDEVEAALWDSRVAKKLLKLNTRNEALQAVRDYLGEAWAILGPPFLQSAAALTDPANMGPVSSENRVGEEVGKEVVSVPNPNRELIVIDGPARRDKEIQRGNVLPKRKHVACVRRSKGGVRITDTEELQTDASCSKYDSVPTPEVNKVQEALKSSSLELQAVVKDPLPDALRLSETVTSDMVAKDKNHEPSVENQSEKQIVAPNPSVNKSVENVQINEPNRENQSSSHQNNAPRLGLMERNTTEPNRGNQSSSDRNNAPRPSLMERNTTARTYEWEESIDGSPEGTENHASRLHLPSPKKRNVSPLKKHEVTKFVRRRKIKRWSLLEEDTLRTGVQKYGKGNWKLILNCYRDIFEERTEVDLKDKWRNMTRY